MANTVPDITNITGLRYIGGNPYRPVYLLTLGGAAQIVVKGEKSQHASASASIKWGSKLMKNAGHSEQVNVKILSQAEIQQFAVAGRRLLPNDRDFPTYIEFGAMIVWTKMPFIAGLSDSDVYGKGAAATDAVYDKLRKADFWDGLGRILAVDIFVGNFDRFDADGDFVNKGNLFFRDLGHGKAQVIGLDFFSARDVSSGESDLLLPADGMYNHLQILRDENARQAYATNVMRGIQASLLRENPQGGYNLFERDTYLTLLNSGIRAGANELRTYLTGKIATYAAANPRPRIGANRGAVPLAAAPAALPAAGGWRRATPAAANNNTREVQQNVVPAGIKARMRYLGWIP